jgi:hypothetical protein
MSYRFCPSRRDHPGWNGGAHYHKICANHDHDAKTEDERLCDRGSNSLSCITDFDLRARRDRLVSPHSTQTDIHLIDLNLPHVRNRRAEVTLKRIGGDTEEYVNPDLAGDGLTRDVALQPL